MRGACCNSCASEMAAEIGNIERFKDEASLALYLAVASLGRSSGKRVGLKIIL